MFINILYNSNCLLDPIVVGNNIIEWLESYKILRVIMNNELKWNNHVLFIVKKGC